jgi:hypothetical protein
MLASIYLSCKCLYVYMTTVMRAVWLWVGLGVGLAGQLPTTRLRFGLPKQRTHCVALVAACRDAS